MRSQWLRHTMQGGAFLLAVLSVLWAAPAAPAPAGDDVDILTFHGDPARTGWNASEHALTPNSVRGGGFGKLWSAAVDGDVYAQPLVVSGVSAGGSARTLVVVATEGDSVYALDAADGRPVWGPVSLGAPVPRSALPCGDIDPVGITSTPVIDRGSSTVYAVALTTSDGGRTKVFKAAALDLATGRMRAGWPVSVAPPTSAGLHFDAGVQEQRGALILVRGTVYIPFGGYFGDCGPYHGWIVGIPTGSPNAQEAYATPTGREGAIWAAGGISSDGSGSLYAATGNSDSNGRMDFGDTVLRLSTQPLKFSGAARDYFTPSNYVALNEGDIDLGSTVPLVLPAQPDVATPHLLFIAGKQGVGYLINADEMGGLSKGNGITGEGVFSRCVFGTCQGGGPEVFSSAAYWDAGASGRFVLVPGRGAQPAPCRGTGGVTALRLGADASRRATFTVAWCSPSMQSAGAPGVSSAGADAGVVWVVDTRAFGSTAGSGTLYALDGVTGTQVYASEGRDALGSARQFIAASVAGGRVYVGAGRTVVAYGLK